MESTQKDRGSGTLDRWLEKGLREGRAAAFERLFELYADGLYRLGYALLFNAADAEDAVQDALIGFIEALRDGRFRGGNGTVEAYLRRSVRHRCIDKLRRTNLWQFVRDDDEKSIGEIQDRDDTPFQFLEEKQLRHCLELALCDLPVAQRTAIVLRLLEDYSYQEIAEELSISVDHVKNLLARARKRLRIALQPLVQ